MHNIILLNINTVKNIVSLKMVFQLQIFIIIILKVEMYKNSVLVFYYYNNLIFFKLNRK